MRTLTPEDREKVRSEAVNWLGVPYKLFGKDFSGVDCSRLVIAVYKRALGINLTNDTNLIFLSSWLFCKLLVIPRDDLQIGDLVFYRYEPCPKERIVTSVAIYIGSSQVVHAGIKLGRVSIEQIDDYQGSIINSKDQDLANKWLSEFRDLTLR